MAPFISLHTRSQIRFGIEAYNVEQTEKAKILDILLSGFHDGRKKTLFCAAVNLLELQELQTLLSEIERQSDMETLTLKEIAPVLEVHKKSREKYATNNN